MVDSSTNRTIPINAQNVLYSRREITRCWFHLWCDVISDFFYSNLNDYLHNEYTLYVFHLLSLLTLYMDIYTVISVISHCQARFLVQMDGYDRF